VTEKENWQNFCAEMYGRTPIFDSAYCPFFCKKQNVVETASNGSEIVAARQATEMIMDLRYNLRMIGIPIDGMA
jgi:hypothetical protein